MHIRTYIYVHKYIDTYLPTNVFMFLHNLQFLVACDKLYKGENNTQIVFSKQLKLKLILFNKTGIKANNN